MGIKSGVSAEVYIYAGQHRYEPYTSDYPVQAWCCWTDL